MKFDRSIGPKYRISTRFLLCAFLLVPLAPSFGSGCGDDDDDNNGGTSTERTGGTTGSGGSRSGGTGGGGSTGTGGSGAGGSSTGLGGSSAGGGGGSSSGGSSGSGGGFGTGGSGTGGSSGGGAGGGTDAGSDDGGGDAAAALSDAEVAGVALELNSGEAMIGGLATTRAKAAAVKSFAAKMVTDHGGAVTRLEKLFKMINVTPGPSPQREMVAATGMATMTKLMPLSGAAFDKAYVDSQVEMHTAALALLDTALIPSAKNAQLKTELTSMRATVAAHLMTATELQSSVGGGSGADGGAGADDAD
jgi:putative membrane protein